jgi:hypothetical protein
MARLKTVRSKKLPLTSRAASYSQALAPVATPPNLRRLTPFTASEQATLQRQATLQQTVRA